MCVCVCVCLCVRERVKVCPSSWERERVRVCVCVCAPAQDRTQNGVPQKVINFSGVSDTVHLYMIWGEYRGTRSSTALNEQRRTAQAGPGPREPAAAERAGPRQLQALLFPVGISHLSHVLRGLVYGCGLLPYA